MVHASSKKLFPWSKHTNYASIVGGRRPSEVGHGTLVTIKNVDRDLSERRDTLTKMERKSLIVLDVQRKELEKSMLKYTEKVREIRDTRTNSLFREIHTRQSHRHSLSDTRSLMQSIESGDAHSLPVDSANIRRRRKRLQGPKQSMFPTIVESVSRSGKRNSLPSLHSSENSSRDVGKSKSNKNNRKEKENVCEQEDLLNSNTDSVLTSRNVTIEINETITDSDRLENASSSRNTLTLSRQIPMVFVEQNNDADDDNSSIGGDTYTIDAEDSGYGSAFDLREENRENNTINTQLSSAKHDKKELLRLPKIHKRKSLKQSSNI